MTVRKTKIEIACAARPFYIYRDLWKPKLGQTLQARQKIGNLQNLFTIFPRAKIPGKVTDFVVVGHIPCKTSHFSHYLLNYRGRLEAHLRRTKHKPSPIPIGSFEIIILLIC